MVWLMRKCVNCGRYTLRTDNCPHCGGKLKIPHPPKFSPDDKSISYRLAMKVGENGHKRAGMSKTGESSLN